MTSGAVANIIAALALLALILIPATAGYYKGKEKEQEKRFQDKIVSETTFAELNTKMAYQIELIEGLSAKLDLRDERLSALSEKTAELWQKNSALERRVEALERRECR